MNFIWDAKNNFILLHFITLHQEQSLTSDINWLAIVNDIHLEIFSTPMVLKNQYEHLLEIVYPKKDSKSLHSTLKHIYLHSLCQQIEDDSKLTLETVYELIRHARAKRINTNDIEQLIKEWNFNYASDEQKKNKNRLFNILNRLRDYTRISSCNSSQPIDCHAPEQSNTNQSSTIHNVEIPTGNKSNGLINIDNKNEKSSFIRRRTQSLTIFSENKDNQVNIGVEWFVPKLKRQQRSSSLHARCQSPISIDSSLSQNQNLASNGILMTTVDNDESSDSIHNSTLRQTHVQPAVSWLPLTDKQIVEKECRQGECQFINGQQLEPVSSSDSDSIDIQWQRSTKKKTFRSSSSRDLHQQQKHGSCKRQRLS